MTNEQRNTCPKCEFPNRLDRETCLNCGISLTEKPPNPIKEAWELAKEKEIQAAHKQALGRFNSVPAVENSSPNPNQKVLGLIGSAVLFIGAFCPIISVPIVGDINYFRNGTGDGVIIVALAIISVFLTIAGKYKGLLITGILSLAMLAFTYFNIQYRLSSARSEMSRNMANNPFRGIGEAMMDSVQIQWGLAVLIVGAFMLIAAGAVAKATNKQQ
jgi:amino acid transporter